MTEIRPLRESGARSSIRPIFAHPDLRKNLSQFGITVPDLFASHDYSVRVTTARRAAENANHLSRTFRNRSAGNSP